jgi:cyanophycin synthetase
MYPIVLDAESDRILGQQGLTRASVIGKGHVVRVRGTANIATGGTMLDVTNMVHPDNVRAAVRAAKAIGLVITGVDFITPDITKSWHEVGGGICELNTTVGLPSARILPGRDVHELLIRGFYPEGDNGRIPTAMIAGTYGTTTALMLASILAAAGHTVGCATTQSIRIGDEELAGGDFAAEDGATVVMRDATVTAAVLEVTSGGLLKRGMYLDHCDVAALLDVEREETGSESVGTPDDMTALRRKVLDAARKAIVLNADDPQCLSLAREFSSLPTLLFSRDAESSALRSHRSLGGDVLYLDGARGGEVVVWASSSSTVELVSTAEFPVTQGSMLRHLASIAMAAAGLAIGLGIDAETIKSGLRSYGKKFAPGTPQDGLSGVQA